MSEQLFGDQHSPKAAQNIQTQTLTIGSISDGEMMNDKD